MQSLLPRWGGSLEKMSSFIDEAKPYYSGNPALRVLEGRIAIEKGYQSCKEKDFACFLDSYKEALTYGAHPSFLWGRGMNLYNLKEYGPALADFDALLDGDPFHHSALYMRAKCKIRMKRYAEAHADIERYIRDYYANERILALRGRVYYKQGEYALALQDYRSAAALNPQNENYPKKIKKIEKKIKKSAVKKEETREDDSDE